MRTIARRKILPTANHEEHTEGESCFFAAVSDHFSVQAELLLLSPWKALPSRLSPFFSASTWGSSWSFQALDSTQRVLTPFSHPSSSSQLQTYSSRSHQSHQSHQSEAPVRPKTRALPLEIASYGPTRGASLS